MKNKKIIVCIVTCFLFNLTIFGDAVIVLDIRPYPIMPNSNYCHSESHNLKHLGQIAQHCLYGFIDKEIVAGIFATYGGYLNVSDVNGQLTFPYKHTKKAINLLITQHIIPIFMAGNTVHHWEIEDGKIAAMFSMEQQHDEMGSPSTDGAKNNPIAFWNTQQIAIPDNKKIPTPTIIIIANPHDMFVPLGATPTTESPSLILPNIYAKEGINHVSDALNTLNLKHLFSPIRYQYKADPARNIFILR